MKNIALWAICASLAATSALADDASPRSVVEANMMARVRSSKVNIDNGIAEIKAGDQIKGCADLRAGSDDLSKALELLAQDLELVKTDTSLTEASRAEGLSQGQQAQAAVTNTYNNLNNLIRQRCA